MRHAEDWSVGLLKKLTLITAKANNVVQGLFGRNAVLVAAA